MPRQNAPNNENNLVDQVIDHTPMVGFAVAAFGVLSAILSQVPVPLLISTGIDPQIAGQIHMALSDFRVPMAFVQLSACVGNVCAVGYKTVEFLRQPNALLKPIQEMPFREVANELVGPTLSCAANVLAMHALSNTH